MIVVGIDPNTRGFHAAALVNVGMEIEELVLLESQHEWQKLGLWSQSVYLVAKEASVLMEMLRRKGKYTDEIYVFIEEPLVAGRRNLRTALLMAQMVGAVIAQCAEYTKKVYLVPVSAWKVGTVGKGGASKTEVADWLNAVHPGYAAQCAGRQDLIDACCIAWHGVRIADAACLVLPEAEG